MLKNSQQKFEYLNLMLTFRNNEYFIFFFVLKISTVVFYAKIEGQRMIFGKI